MSKRVWIWNHYATDMFLDHGGRHYWQAKYLRQQGYDARVFCATTIHNSDEVIPVEGGFIERIMDGIPVVFLKTPRYAGNGKSRIQNMVAFYRGLQKMAPFYAEMNGAPDVILASSVHPLTMAAGIKVAKKLGVPCICEVRDLWPESIVVYTDHRESEPAIRLLYKLEKWIYKRCDALIFTFEGGYDYIRDKGWTDVVPRRKVHYINNAIDVKAVKKNAKANPYEHPLLSQKDRFKVVYAGSIRPANGVMQLAQCAEKLQDEAIEFLIFGDGDERETIEAYCREKNLTNIHFLGRVERQFVPAILEQSDLNVLNYRRDGLWKYGASQNKFFEYLASGKPVIANIRTGYDLIQKYRCGESENFESIDQYADAIRRIKALPKEEYDALCRQAMNAAWDFDWTKLGEKTQAVIDEVVAHGKK